MIDLVLADLSDLFGKALEPVVPEKTFITWLIIMGIIWFTVGFLGGYFLHRELAKDRAEKQKVKQLEEKMKELEAGRTS